MSGRSLYEADFYSWALEQAQLLRDGRYTELDLGNLAEEVEDLARKQADELENHYAALLHYLLRWQFEPEQRSHGWAGRIRLARLKLTEHLEGNPGLKLRRGELFAEACDEARANAAIEADLRIEHFPDQNPYTLDQAMDPDFWPGGQEMPDRDRRAPRR